MPAIPECTGQGADGDHCCYLGSRRCAHLVENTAGRRYACGLMVKYGDWEAMTQSPEYAPVGDYWASRGLPFNYCQTFDPSFCCRPEHRQGRHNENCEPGCADRVAVVF